MFVIVAFIALICGFFAALERTWFGPVREGQEAQRRLNEMIAEQKWQGQITPDFSLYRVLILIDCEHEDELEKIFPILHDISWLKELIIYEPELSEAAIARMACGVSGLCFEREFKRMTATTA